MTGKLWIVEKPDMAHHLARGLSTFYGVQVSNKSTVRSDGYLKLSNGDSILYLMGHLMEMVPVSDYLTKEQQTASDNFSFLPLIPDRFRFQPRSERTQKGAAQMQNGKPVPIRQYRIAIDQIKKAREIVNAGDTDREGQLIVDELLEAAGLNPDNPNKPIWRFPLQSPKESDIVRLLQSPLDKNNDQKWRCKRYAAATRQQGDWLVGINASMAYQTVTGYRRMSVGRVQTPVLNMVVKRDMQIEKFKAHDYFIPVITLADGTQLRWHRRDGAAGQPGFDGSGRIIDENIARQMVSLIARGLTGKISNAQSKKISESPPLPFSLGTLQAAASRQHGMSLKEATKVAEGLYLKHQAISYVGTDCQYLQTSLLEDAAKTMLALSSLYPKPANGADLSLRSRAWNDAKIDEHSAIIPTGTLPSGASPDERAIFETISRRYMAQFYPNFEYMSHKLAMMFGADEFRATRSEVVRQGWRDVERDVPVSQEFAADPNAHSELMQDPMQATHRGRA